MLSHLTYWITLITILFPFACGSTIIYRSQSLFTSKNTDVSFSNEISTIKFIELIQNEYKSFKYSLNKMNIDLENVLHPFLNLPSFIFIDNYFNIDIVSSQAIPIILRRVVPHIMNITRQDYDGSAKNYLSLGWSIFQKDVSEISLDEVSCTHSNYLIKSNYQGLDLCLDINFNSYVIQAKPWNYAAHISLVRPNYVLAYESYDRNFKVELPYKPILKSLGTPSIQITILKGETTLNKEEIDKDLQWQLQLTQTKAPIDIIIMSIREVTRKFCTNFEITKISKICYYCSTTKIVSLKFKDYKNYWKSNKGTFSDSNEIIKWFMNTVLTKTGRTTGSFMRQMEHCNDHISNLGHKWLKMKFADLGNRLSHAQAHVWKSIIKNYTYYTGSKHCVNGKLKEKIVHNSFSRLFLSNALYVGPIPQKFTWSVEDKVNSLQFIACGHQGTSLLQFTAFLDVFDGFVWLFIFITLIVGPILVTYLSCGLHDFNFENISRYFLTIFSFYLEKDDFLLEKELNLKLRLIFISYLMGAQVISSAYKNDNVHRMIQPRLPLSYETYDELLRNNFSVYSRSSDVYFPSFLRAKGITSASKLDIKSNRMEMREKVTGVRITSELHSIISSDFLLLLPNGMKPLDELVYRHSMVHPALSNVLDNASREFITAYNSTGKMWTPKQKDTFVMEQNTQFWEIENILIREEFRKCEKVAFLLPHFKCEEMKREERSGISEKIGNLHLGKETYFKGYNSFTLMGTVPPWIFRRIGYIKNSGIMDWWTQLISKMRFKSGHRLEENEKDDGTTNGTTMEGNISTVFVILTGGYAVALLAFSLEAMYKFFIKRSNTQQLNDSKWAWGV